MIALTNAYSELKRKHQEEFNNFPMVFAFSNKQFEEGMKKLGLKPTDTDKIYSFHGTGGFYRKTDAEALREMSSRHEKEMQGAIDGDTTGKGFIFDMFSYELTNHEYDWTDDLEPTLNSLGLTFEEVNNDKKLLLALKRACNN